MKLKIQGSEESTDAFTPSFNTLEPILRIQIHFFELTGIEDINISATFDSATFTRFVRLVSFESGSHLKFNTDTALGE